IINSGVKINNFLAASLISMYSNCGHGEEALSLFHNVLHNSTVKPDVITLTAVLNASRQCGKPTQQFLHLIDELHIQPDVPLYTVMLPACGDVGALEQDKRILRHIINSGVKINDFLAAALISMYSKCGSLSDAVAVFTEMRHQEQQHGSPLLDVGVWNA